MSQYLLVQYAMRHVGTPYIWGGDDSIRGYDCSGFVQELLASVGADPPGDQTAHSLYEYFSHADVLNTRKPGALSFYGSPQKIVHVGMLLSQNLMIEAGGGDRRTTNETQAIKQNAYVRMRPVDYRSDLVTILLPHYEGISR